MQLLSVEGSAFLLLTVASGVTARDSSCTLRDEPLARRFCISAEDKAAVSEGRRDSLRAMPAQYYDESATPVCDFDPDFKELSSCCPDNVISQFVTTDTAYEPKDVVNPICTGKNCPKIDIKTLEFYAFYNYCGPFNE
ncbi:hypothetical protein PTTG_27591 [Puccinia triticina 1-1 BBBD Race 1]|uniref:Hydrophobin n=2 Tax=Puccinia triticina TaxID=208348 RepID=A0A180GJG8_PUCT1|nr:uncharacterized protein PtA15_2A808 [Puccinia triticina]OAV92684.1 hypothetical protein PTTG_27591 [Puccinia triticina 1-1 BBBD Race 1]WAQ82491.1 hypothetical protein PtA15_2A808 [Puccinia triticina]